MRLDVTNLEGSAWRRVASGVYDFDWSPDSRKFVIESGSSNGIYSVKAVDGLLEGMVENVAVSRGKDEMVDVKLNGQATGADPLKLAQDDVQPV